MEHVCERLAIVEHVFATLSQRREIAAESTAAFRLIKDFNPAPHLPSSPHLLFSVLFTSNPTVLSLTFLSLLLHLCRSLLNCLLGRSLPGLRSSRYTMAPAASLEEEYAESPMFNGDRQPNRQSLVAYHHEAPAYYSSSTSTHRARTRGLGSSPFLSSDTDRMAIAPRPKPSSTNRMRHEHEQSLQNVYHASVEDLIAGARSRADAEAAGYRKAPFQIQPHGERSFGYGNQMVLPVREPVTIERHYEYYNSPPPSRPRADRFSGEQNLVFRERLPHERHASKHINIIESLPRPTLSQNTVESGYRQQNQQKHELKREYVISPHVDNLKKGMNMTSATKNEQHRLLAASGFAGPMSAAARKSEAVPRPRGRRGSAVNRRQRKNDKRRAALPVAKEAQNVPTKMEYDPPFQGRAENYRLDKSAFQGVREPGRIDSYRPMRLDQSLNSKLGPPKQKRLDPPFHGASILESLSCDVFKDIWSPWSQECMILWVGATSDGYTGTALVSVVQKTSIPDMRWNAHVFSISARDAQTTHDAELWAIIKAFDMALDVSSTNRFLAKIVIYTHCQSATTMLGLNSGASDPGHTRLLEKIARRSGQLLNGRVHTELRWRAKRDDAEPHIFGAAAIGLASSTENRARRTKQEGRGIPLVFEGNSPAAIRLV